MGINNLSPFLKKHKVYETLHVSHLKYKKLGIDTPMFLYKFKSTCEGNNWLGCFITLITFFRKWDIHPVFIFEGKSPVEKTATQQNRFAQKQKIVDRTNALESDLKTFVANGTISPLLLETWNKMQAKTNRPLIVKKPVINSKAITEEIERRRKYEFSITPQDIEMVKELLEIMGISFIQSRGEAETECVNLLFSKQIDYIVSEDTDVLAYAFVETRVITSFNFQEESFTRVEKCNVLDQLELTDEEFRDFCIMCGTDYNKNIFKIGVEKSFKLIKDHKRIENLKLDTSVLNHLRVRELFTPQFTNALVKWAILPGPDFEDSLNIFLFKYGIRFIHTSESVYKALTETELEIVTPVQKND